MKKLLPLFGVILIVFVLSCTKENSIDKLIVEQDMEAIAMEGIEMAEVEERIFGQIENVTAGDIESAYPSAFQLKSSTAEVTYPVKTVEYPAAPAKWPRIITVDYGPENIIVSTRWREGMHLRGKVIIKKTAAHRKTGSTRTVSFKNFYFNDMKIVGSKVYTNKGPNEEGNLVFKWVVNLKATDADHFWRKRKVRKERELIDEGETNKWKDNQFMITGEVHGSNSKKWEHTRTIIEPLHRLTWFKYPVSGKVEVVNPKRTFWIDYGQGSEDNIAIMSYYDEEVLIEKEITLGKKKDKK
ncbi:hypothetical protein [Carboxylicivirga marina]|uniref:Lipoprotein n=1 Tax=Carboxylicivirga marina TaxID=2800988 RepID=A0ABS1HQN9_9BACT|nr:hypothetical protein [Carboxylicivirga marina]MBK3519998.1 hypothetical protein [Carboxylicivirga marina]